ncbi:hypothetical protein G6O69_18850 [Pseudenhygromyxa sp. WMMC2535]|uniref:peptidase MA family metallohydrolase n=1 Tax=Pseudenhygromyxa sp. WMMC2535 TaxID=2712867 RepID=UPI001552C5E1|nr:peptidase MA family metallohydrolase [Pseudenhygromyxa sp. WMMC2535]NVB39910.1 hypothetical protein [Pseudenhygromyxa sp. WMMC2535]
MFTTTRQLRRRLSLGRGVARFVAALLLVLAFWTLGPQTAKAEQGRLDGWTLASASEELVVGRAVIRYEPGTAEQAFELAKLLPGWWSEIEQTLGRDLDDSMTIHVVSHAGRVAQATGMPRWVSGVAHPPRGEIAISLHDPDGSPSELSTLLRHELVHVALFRATAGAELPRWFHEGVADSVANEVSLMRAETLAGAIFGSGVPSLPALEASFHGDARQASIAYAAARDFATWLRFHDAEGGEFRQLLSQLRKGRGFEQSVKDAYGSPLAALDESWREGLSTRFLWYPLLGSEGLPVLLLGPLVALAWFRRRQRLAADWARLEAEDALERTARLGLAPLAS